MLLLTYTIDEKHLRICQSLRWCVKLNLQAIQQENTMIILLTGVAFA